MTFCNEPQFNDSSTGKTHRRLGIGSLFRLLHIVDTQQTVRMVHERTDRHINTAICGYACPSRHVTSSAGVGLSPILLSEQTMSTFRRIERGFAIIGLAATAAAGLGCYALYSYHKVTSISLCHLDASFSQDSDKALSDLGRPRGLRGRKLPKEFILHLDLDRTTITDAPSSMTYLSHQQHPLMSHFSRYRPWESFLSGETQTLSLRTVVKSIESAAEDERVKGFLTTGHIISHISHAIV